MEFYYAVSLLLKDNKLNNTMQIGKRCQLEIIYFNNSLSTQAAKHNLRIRNGQDVTFFLEKPSTSFPMRQFRPVAIVAYWIAN